MDLALNCQYTYIDGAKSHFVPDEESREKMKRFGLYMKEIILQLKPYFHSFVGKEVVLSIRPVQYKVAGETKTKPSFRGIKLKD